METLETNPSVATSQTAVEGEKTSQVAQDFMGFVRTIRRLLQVAGSLLFVWMAIQQVSDYLNGGEATLLDGTKHLTTGTVPQPNPKPNPVWSEDLTIGGRTLRVFGGGSGTIYQVPDAARTFNSKAEAVSFIRDGNFTRYTGIQNQGLVDRYMKADTDGNGRLSFAELESFQYGLGWASAPLPPCPLGQKLELPDWDSAKTAVGPFLEKSRVTKPVSLPVLSKLLYQSY